MRPLSPRVKRENERQRPGNHISLRCPGTKARQAGSQRCLTEGWVPLSGIHSILESSGTPVTMKMQTGLVSTRPLLSPAPPCSPLLSPHTTLSLSLEHQSCPFPESMRGWGGWGGCLSRERLNQCHLWNWLTAPNSLVALEVTRKRARTHDGVLSRTVSSTWVCVVGIHRGMCGI